VVLLQRIDADDAEGADIDMELPKAAATLVHAGTPTETVFATLGRQEHRPPAHTRSASAA
jgi:hypothetical protein